MTGLSPLQGGLWCRCQEGAPHTRGRLTCMRRSHSCRCCCCFLLFSFASALLCTREYTRRWPDAMAGGRCAKLRQFARSRVPEQEEPRQTPTLARTSANRALSASLLARGVPASFLGSFQIQGFSSCLRVDACRAGPRVASHICHFTSSCVASRHSYAALWPCQASLSAVQAHGPGASCGKPHLAENCSKASSTMSTV